VRLVPVSFRAADGLALDVTLQEETFAALVGELRIVSPLLAGKVEDAVRDDGAVWLEDEEVEFLAAGANIARKSDRAEDTELERIARLT